MKVYSYIILISFFISNGIFAQSAVVSQADSSEISGLVNDSEKTSTPERAGHQNLNLADSVAFKKFCDSVYYNVYKPFAKEISFATINNQVYKNLKFKPLPKQQVYFSIHDYTAGCHLTRVSQYENPFFDNAKKLRFLWSGHAVPYQETGAAENYLRSNQNPPLIIKFIRGRKGLEGIWLERLKPEFHRIP